MQWESLIARLIGRSQKAAGGGKASQESCLPPRSGSVLRGAAVQSGSRAMVPTALGALLALLPLAAPLQSPGKVGGSGQGWGAGAQRPEECSILPKARAALHGSGCFLET